MPPYKIPNQLVLAVNGQKFSSNLHTCMSKVNQSLNVSNACNLPVIVLLFSYVGSSCSQFLGVKELYYGIRASRELSLIK